MLAVAGSVLEVCHLSALLFVLRKRYCKGAEAIDDKFQVFLQGNMSGVKDMDSMRFKLHMYLNSILLFNKNDWSFGAYFLMPDQNAC